MSLLNCKKSNTFQGFDAVGLYCSTLNCHHSQIEISNTKQETGIKCYHILNRNVIKNRIMTPRINLNLITWYQKIPTPTK